MAENEPTGGALANIFVKHTPLPTRLPMPNPTPRLLKDVLDELARGNAASEARAVAAEERAAAAEARADAAEKKRHRTAVALVLLEIFVGVLSIAVTVLVTMLVAG